MIEPTMVKGPILVKAKKVGESNDSYYLEFELTESQKMQFVTELILEHSSRGSLNYETANIGEARFLREVLGENPNMPEELRETYLTKILHLVGK